MTALSIEIGVDPVVGVAEGELGADGVVDRASAAACTSRGRPGSPPAARGTSRRSTRRPASRSRSRARASVGFSSNAWRRWADRPAIVRRRAAPGRGSRRRWTGMSAARRGSPAAPRCRTGRGGESRRRPGRRTSRKAGSSRIQWSAGSTAMTSSSGRSIIRVARAIAAAVLRPAGSTISWTSGTCSRTKWPYFRSVTTKTSRTDPTSGKIRATVRWRSVSSPRRGRKGFGRSGRLSGRSRVPPPPARITMYIASILRAGRPAIGRPIPGQCVPGPGRSADVPFSSRAVPSRCRPR